MYPMSMQALQVQQNSLATLGDVRVLQRLIDSAVKAWLALELSFA